MRSLRDQCLVQFSFFASAFLCALPCPSLRKNRGGGSKLGPTMEKPRRTIFLHHGNRLTLVTEPSGKLAAQIEAGAPFTLFLSANEKWARHLESKGVLTDVHPYANRPWYLVGQRKCTDSGVAERIHDEGGHRGSGAAPLENWRRNGLSARECSRFWSRRNGSSSPGIS
jgi:hypothetical protein